MKLLITGGAGFIGGNFIRYYLQAHPGCEIINLDKLTYAGNRASLDDIANQPAYRFVQGDICSAGLVRELMGDGVDVVVNFAAESHVDRSIDDAAVFLDTNIQGTYNLLKCSRDAGVSLFLQVSTDEVYGSLGATGFFTECSPIQPNSPYAASKASADLVCRSLYETFGFPVIISRSCNNFGPYQFPEKLIPLFITNLLEDRPVPVYGDGLNVRDWIHVEDHCRALDAILQKGKPGEVYNVGARQEKTNLQITTLILQELGKPESYKQFVEDRLGHDRRYAIDPARLENELDWRPAFGFEQAIKETVAWYREHPQWWEPLKRKAGQ